MTDCPCASKHLYSQKNQEKEYKFFQGNQSFKCIRQTQKIYTPNNSKYLSLFQETIENGYLTYPVSSHLDQVNYFEIMDNPLFFYKEYISKNKPCKIVNAIDDWPAMEQWSDIQYLSDKMKNTEQNKITVDITPDGFADSAHGDYFIQPYQDKMSFKQFFSLYEAYQTEDFVPYIQKQNSNLTQEFDFLQTDIDMGLKNFFQKSYFDNSEPDAINFWMGFSDSVSSMHKDPYENLYAVIQGEKHFTLMPSVVYPFLGPHDLINSHWHYDKEKKDFSLIVDKQSDNEEIKEDHEMVEWCNINPDCPQDQNLFPMIQDLPQYHVVVEPGEVLYLPALWYHQVTQYAKKESPFIIAVNFWFDMIFDHKFRLFDVVKNLVDIDRDKVIKK